jgi:hypothetical protein
VSDPAAGSTPAGPARPTKPPSTRWIDALSAVFLAAACALVLFAASPSLLRAATGADLFERAPADELQEPQHRRLLLHGSDPDEGEGQELAPDDDPHMYFPRSPDSLDEPPGRQRSREPAQPDEDTEGDLPLGSLRIGAVRERVVLLDAPEGSTRAELDAGETVVIVKEAGDWVLVHGKSSKMGWARKRDIWTGGAQGK